MNDLSAMRKSYTQRTLSKAAAAADPFKQFQCWFAEVSESDSIIEPNAMTLATADGEGKPHARTVLLKQFDSRRFVFFSNYTSAKGQDLTANPYAELLFFWPSLERQVRIQGAIERIPAEESDTYFAARPRQSQLGAWASQQSSAIANRLILDNQLNEVQDRFKEAASIARPAWWGGYQLTPEQFEFWQGRPDRLHDRLRYSCKPDSSWTIERLAP